MFFMYKICQDSDTIHDGTGISCKKNIARKIFKCVYLSLFIITKLFLKSESLQTELVDGSNKKKPAPSDHKSSLKILIAKLFFVRCPCAFTTTPFFLKNAWCKVHKNLICKYFKII